MSLLNIRSNPILLTDCYTLSHSALKIDVSYETSHLYNRSSGMILFGLQETFINALDIQIEHWMVEDAEQYAQQMGLHFPSSLWNSVITELDGRIPLHVEMLPEGIWVPRGTPFAQVSNTVEGYGECVSWFEGLFMHAYFPSTCATEAFFARQYLEQQKAKYNYDESFLKRFHSFGFRGSRSLEDAYWAGTAWNLFLEGSDDFHTIQHTPNANISSIAALAHKVTQQFDTELECYMHAVDATKKMGEKIVALVIDTYNADRFIDQMAVPVAKYAEQSGIHVVFRPDSGSVVNQTINIYTKCVEVHKCPNTSVIIGMDMSFEKAKEYDSRLSVAQVPLNYVSYGIGAGYYKHIERDTLGWSMKTSYSNGKPRMKFSNDTIKQSIPGKVDLYYNDNHQMVVYTRDETKPFDDNKLFETIYISNHEVCSITDPDWDLTRQLALKQDVSQQQIILSGGVQNLIEEIKIIHGLN